MSSRREEKEQRRAERVAAEEEAARAKARKRRLGMVAGAVLGVAALAAVVFALMGSIGGGDDPEGPETTSTGTKAPVPPQRTTDLNTALKAAGCQVRTFTPGPNDRQHVEGKVKYEHNPPVFGPHDIVPASDGNYVGQGTPRTEKLVHSLEHGRILIQYKPGLDRRRVAQLETLLQERPKRGVIPGYNTLLIENRTGMVPTVAATSWGRQLLCPRFDDATFDALRTFRTRYVDTGPEFIPQPQ